MLTIIEVLRQISSKVKKRFPSYGHLVEAGVMKKSEMNALERAQTMTDYPVYWVPISWASSLVTQAWENGYMKVMNENSFITEKDLHVRSQDSTSPQ